jgi:hypothetical protein
MVRERERKREREREFLIIVFVIRYDDFFFVMHIVYILN